jgi:hypothetical protein
VRPKRHEKRIAAGREGQNVHMLLGSSMAGWGLVNRLNMTKMRVELRVLTKTFRHLECV